MSQEELGRKHSASIAQQAFQHAAQIDKIHELQQQQFNKWKNCVRHLEELGKTFSADLKLQEQENADEEFHSALE